MTPKRAKRGPYEIHGKSFTSEYNTWKNIRARCHRKTNPHFYRYGARGITVCDRWRKSFQAFLADMKPKPSPDYTIERKNNNRGYTTLWLRLRAGWDIERAMSTPLKDNGRRAA